MLFSDLLTNIDSALKQKKESGEFADREKFRKLPWAECHYSTMTALYELVRENSTYYRREVVFQLFDSSAGVYYPRVSGNTVYIDIVEDVDSDNNLTIPEDVLKILKVMTPIGDTERTGDWIVPFDTTVSNSKIYCPSDREIYNSDGWVAGDTVRVEVIMAPKKIKQVRDTGYLLAATAVTPGTYTKITVASNLYFERGDSVTLAGFTPTDYNTTATVVYATSTEITLNLDSSGFTDIVAPLGTISFDYAAQLVDVDFQWEAYLILKLKDIGLRNVRQQPEMADYSKLRRYESEHKDYRAKINRNTKMPHRGYGFGGRRG